MVWACREKTGRLCSEERRLDDLKRFFLVSYRCSVLFFTKKKNIVCRMHLKKMKDDTKNFDLLESLRVREE